MRYLFVVEKDEKNLSGFFPDVPGCVGLADSVEEILRYASEALELHLEGEKQLPLARGLDDTILLLSGIESGSPALDEAA